MHGFLEYLIEQVKAAEEEIKKLEAEGRQDEADFCKAKRNIYEICNTVTNALWSRPEAGLKAVKAQFERFRTQWSAALDRAKASGDARNTVIEETKLAALEDVISHFAEVRS
ncbi:MAG: hypothetical protein IKD87_06425 [Oscillospiraceae bacterium]|nr:hypothetical protein [Oscillospiraceae bacterium]